MKKILFFMLVISVLFFSSMLSLAQEESMNYSWGEVVKVSPEEITVSEYSYDLEKEIDVVYKIEPDVKLKNVTSINNLNEGDSVEIDYVIVGADKVAKAIILEELFEEDLDY